jgi:glucan phosphorylase
MAFRTRNSACVIVFVLSAVALGLSQQLPPPSHQTAVISGTVLDTLLTSGDHYMHLADLTSYVQAQERLGVLYADPDAWSRKAILNVASSGKFSSDRTISEYTTEIWKAEPCPVL